MRVRRRATLLVVARGHLALVAAALVALAGSAFVAAGQAEQPLAGRTIVLDPGHGGEDPGFVTSEVLEKDLNLELALALAGRLRAAGASVHLTRDTDRDYVLPRALRQGKTRKQSDLDARIRLINEARPDIVLSIHANGTRNTNYGGPEVFYLPSSPGSQALAMAIQEELRRVPGVQKRLPKPGDYYLLRQLSVPVVIIEVGYLTNREERQMLLNPRHRQALVFAISEGVKKFLTRPVVNTSHLAGAPAARVALIIDDLGYRQNKGTDDILAMDLPLTLAIMPNMPDSRRLAEEAHRRGLEVIVHLPMEPNAGDPGWLPPGAIMTGFGSEEIKSRVRRALEDVPYAVGANNHMGSRATADRRVMEAVFSVLRDENMFFLNSRTAPPETVRKAAAVTGLPLLERDVFLDEVNSLPAIKRQLALLRDLALKKGTAIGIGHVGPQGQNTARAIREMAPLMEQAGVRLVPLSELARSVPLEWEEEATL